MESATQPVRPERRDAAENRQRILDAARKLFDEHGVEHVSMSQIAAEAGVGPGTLYRRYANKSDLCFDMVQGNLSAFLIDVHRYLERAAETPPRERLREVIRRFIAFREDKLHLLAGAEDSPRVYPAKPRPASKLFDEVHQCFVGLFDEIDEREGTRHNSIFKADLLIDALETGPYSFQREVRGYSPEDILEQICQTFL